MSDEKELVIPAKFGSLFLPNSDPVYAPDGRVITPGHRRKRFYIRYGGRAGGKSHAMAMAAVLRAYQGFERVLCAREVMNTLADSIHRLLVDKIKALGLEQFFVVTDNEIRVPSQGSSFIFKGLGNNVESVTKSLEGITLTLVDEAQAVSEHSWQVLLPGVLRAPTSEIWVAYNANTIEDPTHVRFVLNADPDRYDVELVNYYDNPHLPEAILEQVESDRKRLSEDDFANIWLGVPRVAREGGIFQPEKIGVMAERPAGLKLVRAWDLASSAVLQKRNGVVSDPDYTVGALMGYDSVSQLYVIVDLVRLRGTPDVVEQAVVNTAALDGYEVEISMAQDPGQAGLSQVQHYARKLAGYRLHTSTETGSKAVRAGPFASQVNCSNVRMVKAHAWNDSLVNEFKGFNGEKNGPHDDIVDACSRAFSRLVVPSLMQKMRLF